MNNKIKIKSVAFMLMLMMLTLIKKDISYANSNNYIRMDCTYGYEQMVEMGTYSPVKIKINNEMQGFDATVAVSVSAAYDNDSQMGHFTYSSIDEKSYQVKKNIKINNQTTDITLYVPLISEKTFVNAQILRDGIEICSQSFTIEAQDYTKYLYIAVLSDNPSGLDYFNEASMYAYADFSLKKINLNANDIPEENYGLDMFDIMIVDNFDISTLTQNQTDAVRNWLKNGGTLISGIKNNESIMEKFIFKLTGIQISLDDEDYFDNNNISFIDDITVSKLQYHDGMIGLADIDLNSENLMNWDYYNAKFAEELICEVLNIEKLKYIDSYRLYGSHNNYWNVSSTLLCADKKNMPHYFSYIIIMAAYLICAGPLLYIFLKKIKKRQKLRKCQLLLALLFTAVIYIISINSRYNAPFISYFNILSMGDKYSKVSYFDITAPFNNQYSLYLDRDYSYEYLYTPIYSYTQIDSALKNNPKVSLEYGNEENTVTIKNERAFENNYFIAESKAEEKNTKPIKVSLNLFDDNISGSIVNNSDTDIENAIILMYNKIIMIGEIKAKETYDLSNYCVKTYSNEFAGYMNQKVSGYDETDDGRIKEGYESQYFKKSILDFYINNSFAVSSSKCVLIGFAKEKNSFELQRNTGFKAYGMTMVEVPVQVNYEKDNKIYEPYVRVYSEDSSYYGYRMYTNESTFTFKFEESLSDISLMVNDMEYYDEKYHKSFDGKMYFYNITMGVYDLVSNDMKKFDSEFMKNYISNNNELIVKFVKKETDISDTDSEKDIVLPIFSATGGRAYAKD